MATTKKTKQAEEVKTIATLHEELATKRQELLEAKRGHAAGELTNPRVITSTRKEIARLLMAIRSQEIAAKESN